MPNLCTNSKVWWKPRPPIEAMPQPLGESWLFLTAPVGEDRLSETWVERVVNKVRTIGVAWSSGQRELPQQKDDPLFSTRSCTHAAVFTPTSLEPTISDNKAHPMTCGITWARSGDRRGPHRDFHMMPGTHGHEKAHTHTHICAFEQESVAGIRLVVAGNRYEGRGHRSREAQNSHGHTCAAIRHCVRNEIPAPHLFETGVEVRCRPLRRPVSASVHHENASSIAIATLSVRRSVMARSPREGSHARCPLRASRSTRSGCATIAMRRRKRDAAAGCRPPVRATESRLASTGWSNLAEVRHAFSQKSSRPKSEAPEEPTWRFATEPNKDSVDLVEPTSTTSQQYRPDRVHATRSSTPQLLGEAAHVPAPHDGAELRRKRDVRQECARRRLADSSRMPRRRKIEMSLIRHARNLDAADVSPDAAPKDDAELHRRRATAVSLLASTGGRHNRIGELRSVLNRSEATWTLRRRTLHQPRCSSEQVSSNRRRPSLQPMPTAVAARRGR